jgi:hypothetical protein
MDIVWADPDPSPVARDGADFNQRPGSVLTDFTTSQPWNQLSVKPCNKRLCKFRIQRTLLPGFAREISFSVLPGEPRINRSLRASMRILLRRLKREQRGEGNKAIPSLSRE